MKTSQFAKLVQLRPGSRRRTGISRCHGSERTRIRAGVFETTYFPLVNFARSARGIRQRAGVFALARLLQVARSLSVGSSQLQYRVAQSGRGSCRESMPKLASSLARSSARADASELPRRRRRRPEDLSSGDIRVPHKLDILPEDVRYWTLLDVR